MTYRMREPVVLTVYPTFAVIHWEPPYSVNAPTEVDCTLSWIYTVEWTSTHSLNKECCSRATKHRHAVIEVPYPNETISVRIVARADDVSADVEAYSSTNCTICAKVTAPMPWLSKQSMKCYCIFDALLFASNKVQCIESIPDECDYAKAEIMSVCLLESSFACIIVDVSYNEPPLPMTSSTVYYFIICSKTLVKKREKMLHSTIQELLKKTKASAVFCGIGEMGSSAVLAANLFMGSIPESCRELNARVFCITYGSPRRMVYEDSLGIIPHSLMFSGNFLYYTGLLDTPDSVSDYTSPPFTTHGIMEKGTNEGLYLFNAPLGIQCGPRLNLKEGLYYLHTRCSGMEAIAAGEYNEQFDVSNHLRILSRLLLSRGDGVLRPVIHTIEHTVEDGVMVCFRITGRNLQYFPQLCVLSRGGCPASISVTRVTPRHVDATFSLTEMIIMESSTRLKILRRLRVNLAFLTDFGYTAHTKYIIEVPGDVAELLFRENRGIAPPNAWLYSHPMNLIDNAIVVEPLLATSMTNQTRKHELSRHASTELLEALAGISDLTNYYVTKKQSGSLLGFMASVAAKVSSSSSTSIQTMAPMSIEAPPMREAVFEKFLREYVNSKKRTVSILLASLAKWKQRLYQGLHWLSDGGYRDKLRYFLSIFEKTNPIPNASLVSLEISLFTHVLLYLRNKCDVPNLSYLVSLHHAMSFENFYHHVHPLFLASLPASGKEPVIILLEAAALWAVCLIFHLRCSYLFTHMIVVAGCAGCGCTTMCNAIMRLRMNEKCYFKNSKRVKSILIRRAEEYELDDLKEFLRLGLSATVIVLGEFTDIKGMGYSAIWSSIQRSLSDKERQRIYTFLSKADELVGLCGDSSGRTTDINNNDGADPVRVLLDTVVSLASESSTMKEVPNHLVAVSFAPSVAFLQSSLFVQKSGLSPEDFAERLLAVSLGRFQNIFAHAQKNTHR